MAVRRKRPDILLVLAVLIGLGVVVTEVTYGQSDSDNRAKTSVSR